MPVTSATVFKWLKIGLVVAIVVTVVWFVIKYWKVIKWLGVGVAAMAAFPFLADIIAGVIGGVGVVGAAVGKLYQRKGANNAKSPNEEELDEEDAKAAPTTLENTNTAVASSPDAGIEAKAIGPGGSVLDTFASGEGEKFGDAVDSGALDDLVEMEL